MRAIPQNDKQSELLQIIAKLCLKNAQELRMLCSIAYLTFKMKADCPLVEAAATAKTKHADATRGQSGHKEGAPDGFCLVAILLFLHDSHSCNAEQCSAIQQFLTERPHKSEALQRDVLCCKVQEAFAKEFKKIYLRLAPECKAIEELITEQMKKLGGEVLYGQAPRGSLERRAQELLKAIETPSS